MNKKGIVKFGIFGAALIGIIFFLNLLILSNQSSALEIEQTYSLGDRVKVDLTGIEDYTIKITTPSTSYIFQGSENVFLFEPEEEGAYTFSLNYGDSFESYSFVVITETFEEEFYVEDNETSEDFSEEINFIEIGEPVRWILNQNVSSSNPVTQIEIPSVAENISVYKIDDEVREKISAEIKDRVFSDLLTRAVTLNSKTVSKTVSLENVEGQFEIEYYTPGPEMKEIKSSLVEKEVVVSSPVGIHYENVLAFSELPKTVESKDQVRIYWKEENKYVDFNILDENEDGVYDFVQWVVPHLSEQTFEIIVIVKAEHLDRNREFVEDVYDFVSAKDNEWVSIPKNDYVRVVFEKKLTSQNDITLYARSSDSRASVEVYEKDGSEVVAEFPEIMNDQMYRVLLNNLEEEQDTFDLRIIGGDVEFDYIVDPSNAIICNATACTEVFNSTGSTTWLAPAWVNSVRVVAVGGGGGGSQASGGDGGSGGGGGGLGWRNNIAVVPGTTYTVVVGTAGAADTNTGAASNAGAGGNSYFINTTTVAGFGGAAAGTSSGGSGGSFFGTGGGTGGAGGSGDNNEAGGGGGAGGYSGNGGAGGSAGGGSAGNGGNGAGGGGGGGGDAGNDDSAGGGGGVGIFGQGSNGAGASGSSGDGTGGGGGSGGQNGFNGDSPQGHGGLYGGGGGGAENTNTENGNGAQGAVAITYNLNSAPTHTNPILISTNGRNSTAENLTVYNQSTSDADGHSVKNIISWIVDGSNYNVFNMPFEGASNSTFTREYSSGLNGSVLGPTFFRSGGHDGFGVYDFDGSDDYVSVTGLSSFLSDSATFAFWINTTQTGSNTMWQAPGISGIEQSGGGDDIFWGWIDASGNIGMQKGNTEGSRTNTPINDGEWHYIVMTWNSSTGFTQMYVDGSLDDTGTTETGTVGNAFSSLGRIEDTGGTPVYFDGMLDDVMVFDRILTAEQVSVLYQRTDKIVLNETSVGQVWQSCVTPSDGFSDGQRLCSNTITVVIDDTSAPAITISSPSNGATIADVTPLLNVSVSEIANSILYSVNGGTNRTLCNICSSGYTFLHLPEGAYTVSVFANDSSGNANSSLVSFTIETDFGYVDTFIDNSSLDIVNGVTWNIGNVSFSSQVITYVDEDFETYTGSFSYLDDIYQGTSNPGGSDGTRVTGNTNCESNGDCLEVYQNSIISSATSGGWNVSFEVTGGTKIVNVSFYWTNFQEAGADAGEFSRFYARNVSDGSEILIDEIEAGSPTSNSGYYSYLALLPPGHYSFDAGGWASSTSGADEDSGSYLDNVLIQSIGGEGSGVNNFTVNSINVSETITQLTNITWDEYGTDQDNEIIVEVSSDNGLNWATAVNGKELLTLNPGSALFYRVLFNTANLTTLTVTNFVLNWSNASVAPPVVSIVAPSGTIDDVTPLLNVSVDRTSEAIWYNINGGNNITLCNSCSSTSRFIHVPEGSNTVNVFANDTANRIGSDSESFTVNMNYHFFDDYNDNSSLNSINGITWNTGNVSYIASREQITFIGCEEDTIEENNWLDNGAQPGSLACVTAAEIGDASPRTGTYTLGLTGDFDPNLDMWNRSIDLSGYVGVNISLWFSTEDTEGGDEFTMYYWDGASWQFLAEETRRDSGSQTSWQEHVVSIPDSAANSDFAIRVEWETSSTAEYFMVDDVNVTGIPSSGSSFLGYSINTTSTITGIRNVTWNSAGEDSINNISVSISADNGDNWFDAAMGQGISIGSGIGNTLLYNVTFNAQPSILLTLLDLNITWESQNVLITYPLNTSYGDVVDNITYSLSPDLSFSNCKYSLNGGITNNSISCGADITGISSSEGSNTWTVYATAGATEYSDSVTFSVDSIAPNVTLNLPDNGELFTGTFVEFNWTATDSSSPVLSCNLTIDSVVEASDLLVNSGESFAYGLTLSEGTHYWDVTCLDTLGNSNTSETRSFDIDIETTLRQVIKGSGVAGAAVTDVIINPPLQNISKAFHFVTYSHSFENDHADTFRSSEIVNTTLLRVYGDNSGGNNNVDFTYKIFEFTTDSPLNVQRETLSVNSGTIVNFSLDSPVNLSQSFLIFEGHSHHSTDTTIGSEELERLRLVNSTTVEYVVGAQDGGDRDVRVEVIDWRDSEYARLAQRNIVSMGAGQTSLTITPPVSVNPNKTLLFISFAEGTGSSTSEPPSEIGLYSTIEPDGDIFIQRQSTGPELLIAWELMEFQSSSNALVQHSSISFNSGTLINTTQVNPVNINRSGAFGTVATPFGHSAGMSSSTTTNAIDRMMFEINITGVSTVEGVRQDSTGTAFLGFQILEILAGPQITNVNVTDITSAAARVTWDTNVLSNSTVNYGTDLSLGSFVYNQSLTSSGHSIYLSGLSGNTTYFFNVTSCNSEGCTSEGVYNFTTDVSAFNPPNVILISPADLAYFNTSNVTLLYNVTDIDDNIVNATLVLNGVLNESKGDVLDGGINNFTLVDFPEGVYNWTVNVTDDTNLVGTASQRGFTVDYNAPNITLNYPDDGAGLTSVIVDFNLTVVDGVDGSLTCDLFVDSIVVENDFEAVSSNITVVTESVSIGSHFWNVTCMDDTGNIGFSETRNFSITDSAPSVSLVSPATNYFSNTGNITLEYNATDNNWLVNATLLINGLFNRTNESEVFNGEISNFTLVDFPEGVYNWTVNVSDSAGFTAQASPQRTFTVDRTSPAVNLNLPLDNAATSVEDVSFNFTVTDNLDSSLVCDLYAGEFSDLGFVVPNGVLTNRDFTGFTDGIKVWNVTCVDDANNTGFSGNRNLNVSVYPEVILNTTNGTFFSDVGVSLRYIPSDNTNLSSCSLYVNGAFNQNNQSAVVNGAENLFNAVLSNGFFSWHVICEDLIGLQTQSETRYFTVDDEAPSSVTLFSPSDGANLFTSSVQFNYTVIDNIDSFPSCDILVNGVLEDSFNATNGSLTSRNVGFSVGGFKLWNVTCTDDAGNSLTSETRNFTLSFAPIVTLTNPPNDVYFNTSVVELFYQVTDDNDNIANATLVLNGVFNVSNDSLIVNDAVNNFTVSLPDGFYTWNVNVTDDTGLVGTDVNFRNFTIDTVAPNVTLFSPVNGTIESSNNVTFHFMAVDAQDSLMVCDIYVNGAPGLLGINATNGSVVERRLIYPDGSYLWYTQCVDDANNTGVSSVFNFTVEAPPNVTLDSPANNHFANSTTVQFYYTPYDPIGLANCSLYLNGVINESIDEPTSGVQGQFEVVLPEGYYNWTVGCVDADPDFNFFAPSARNLTVDVSSPTLVLNFPLNGENTLSAVDFNFTVSDTLDNILRCDLNTDGTLNVGNINAISGEDYIQSISGFSLGLHSWNVSCFDDANNSVSVSPENFNVTLADFAINFTDIVFNQTLPVENETVTINATVRSLVNVSVRDIIVQVYSGDPDSGGQQINGNLTIDSLSGLGEATVSVTWETAIGTTQIYALVDPPIGSGNFNEWNEGNNEANRSLSVSAWQFVYGNINENSIFELAGQDDQNVVVWNASNFENGNVYVSDSESVVSWLDLQALGKSVADADAPNDFADADALLNLTGFVDSISVLFFEEKEFFVFNRFVDEVPVANSTNSSNFFTGILWDTSDDSDGQFSQGDMEDIVFVSNISEDVAGAYGVYDYEMRVPATLREYIDSGDRAVTFYVEIR